MKVFGLWERLTKIVFFKGKQVAIDPATQTGAADKVISIPDMAAGATQEMVLTTQAQTLTNKTISGADNTLQAIPGASLNNDSVTASKLDPTTVAGLGLVMTDTGAGVDRLDVNPDGSTLEINADALRIKDSGVTEAKIQTGAVTADKIGSNAVTAAKLNADVAGAGLVLGTGNALEVAPDGSTLELNGDTVRIKALGVDTAQLKDSAVTNVKIANATIELGKMAVDVANQQKVLKRQVTTGAVIAGNIIPDSGTVLTDSAANSNVALKTLDRLQTYTNTVTIAGASTELFLSSRVGVAEVTGVGTAGLINQISVENVDGSYLVILNRTGSAFIVDNDTGTDASRRIITGTGGPISVADKAALFLVYRGGTVNKWTVVGGTGGGAGGTVTQVTTAAPHGFTAADKGKVLYLNGSTYATAIASAANTAEVVGILAGVIDSDTFELATGGAVEVIEGNDFVGGSVPAIGEVVFLSASEAGKMTIVEPTVVGQVSKPLGIIFGANKMFFYNMRGSVVGGANARTQIAVNSNATTTIQSVGSYTAGSLAGWIEWSATTSVKFYFQAQFAKNGANNNYNIASQFVGDTPPLGFSISITAAGDIQVTLPTIAGFTTGFANFALNAPAVGTTLPLTVAGSNVVSNYKNVTAAYTVTTNDYYISATGAAGYTITLPAATSVSGKMFVIKSRLDAGQVLTVDANATETIDGALTVSLFRNEAVHIVSNGTSWEIF